jgi:SPP1 family predicted phage head-tail adaptor
MTSTNDLNKIRAEREKLLSETVYVQRLTRTSDTAGGSSEAWQTVYTVDGSLVQSSGNERVIADRIGAVLTYTATLPYDTDVLQGDRLQVNGRQYQIETILDRSEKTSLRIICVEVL